MRTCQGLVAVMCIATAGVGYSQSSANCVEYDQLRAHGRNHFAQIKGKELLDEMRLLEATFKLGGSAKCEIEPSDRTLSRYSCKWFVSQGKAEGEATAKRAFESLFNSVVRCVPPTDSQERGKKSAGGEWASILDAYPGLKPNQVRWYQAHYRYRNHWWAVELEYEVNDDYKP